jgi:hypothetical protein
MLNTRKFDFSSALMGEGAIYQLPIYCKPQNICPSFNLTFGDQRNQKCGGASHSLPSHTTLMYTIAYITKIH